MARRQKTSASKPGQPGRHALLEAARHEFSTHGFDATRLTAVANGAGVNSAMVHYYFGGKQGLYDATLELALGGILKNLLLSRKRTPSMAGFVRALMRKLAEDPWLAPLILRELAGGPQHPPSHHMRGFIQELLSLMLDIVATARQEGTVNEDIDPRMAVASIAGMALMPFVLLPSTTPVLGLDITGRDLHAVIEHTQAQVMRSMGSDGS